uniref:hemagglutinin repeat-containing protein n=1 Tax=Pluralibacter gergoviae TaxID=61647 RepID=UPI00384F174E
MVATDGDLNVQGARLQAGRDMGLAAARDINMTSGQNSSQSSGSNRSHGGSVGVGVAVGSGSAGISSEGANGGQFLGNMASGLVVAANGSGHDSSPSHAANGLSPIFDKEKEQRRLQEAQLIGEIGTQVGDIARTEGKIAGTQARKDSAALAQAKAELAAEAAKKGQVFSGDSEAIAQRAYDNAMQSWGTGSAIQQGIQAATAAVQGLAGGDLAAAVAGGAAPYLAEVIHRQTTDPVTGEVNKAANLMAHAVLGAAVALAQDHNALAGAAGGASGEAAGMIAQSLYGKKASELTEDEKQRVSALGTLAAGLAGGLAGGDT